MSRHATREELISRMYGLDVRLDGSTELDTHLAICQECRAELGEVEAQRAASANLDIPPEFLAVQRREILARVEGRSTAGFSWIPATAAAALVLTLALYYDRGPGAAQKPVKSAVQEVADYSLLSEISAMEVAEEPRAAEPIRGLFEEVSLEETK